MYETNSKRLYLSIILSTANWRKLLDLYFGNPYVLHFVSFSSSVYFCNSVVASLTLSLCIAENIEEFEHSIMQKKMKIPKMSSRNTGSIIGNHFGEERLPLRHKKVSKVTPEPIHGNSNIYKYVTLQYVVCS